MSYPTSKEKKENKKNEYISRCVHYLVHKEGKTPNASVGQCEGMWKQSKKRKQARGSKEEPQWEENENKIATIIPPVL